MFILWLSLVTILLFSVISIHVILCKGNFEITREAENVGLTHHRMVFISEPTFYARCAAMRGRIRNDCDLEQLYGLVVKQLYGQSRSTRVWSSNAGSSVLL